MLSKYLYSFENVGKPTCSERKDYLNKLTTTDSYIIYGSNKGNPEEQGPGCPVVNPVPSGLNGGVMQASSKKEGFSTPYNDRRLRDVR